MKHGYSYKKFSERLKTTIEEMEKIRKETFGTLGYFNIKYYIKERHISKEWMTKFIKENPEVLEYFI